ncbi:MAG: AtpZ/AtpI family protein [Mariniphaga sp.]
MSGDDHGKKDFLNEYAKYSSLLIQMIIIAAAGVLGGIQLDKWLKIKGPVFTVGLTVVMSAVAVYHLFNTLLKKK